MSRNHVLISGTGRAGTTFLVELLTNLGLDTGFKTKNIHKHKNAIARAGLETDIRKDNAPYIVKNPHFCDHADEVLKRNDINIDHVFIPMRDLHAAAESRRLVTEKAESELTLWKQLKNKMHLLIIPGGLWHTKDKYEQEGILLQQLYKLTLALSISEVPVTLLNYPRLLKDSLYLFNKLKSILNDTTYDHFKEIFDKTVRPDLAHSFNKNDK